MPTITTTVTAAEASGVTTTVTTTEATPENLGFTHDGVLQTWVLNAAAEKVAPYCQFDAIGTTPGFKDAMQSVECTGNSVGSTRKITLKEPAGAVIVEQCVSANANGYAYSMTEGDAMFGFKPGSYVGHFTVAPVNATTCTVTWTNSYLSSDPAATKAALLGFVPLMDVAWAAVEAEINGGGTSTYAATVGITGGTGYVGGQTVKDLLSSGYYVRAGVREGEDTSFFAALAAVLPGKIDFFVSDLNDDGSFDECFTGCDYVIHLAATVNVWDTDPHKEIIAPMINGVKSVLASAKKAGVKRVVMTSSTFSMTNWMAPTPPVNGKLYTEEDWSTEITEEMIQGDNGFNAYAAGKPLQEKAAWEYAKANGMDLVCINPGIVYGPPVRAAPGGKTSLTIGLFCGAATADDAFMTGGVFPAVDVRDIAKALIAGVENPDAKGRYHITHRETFDHVMYNKYVGDAFPRLNIKPFAGAAMSKECADNSRCIELIGPLIPYKKMCEDSIRACLANGMMSYP